MISLIKIAQLFNITIDNDMFFDAISIDSRTIKSGSLFVAIIGENFDGHDFISQAIERGAHGLLVSHDLDISDYDIPVIKVKDTILALGEIAKYLRSQFTSPVIALTGSCGKTTVKQMIYTILALQGRTFATPGNFNNHIGVPLSVFQLNNEYQAAIFELGANHIGEIEYLSRIVSPDVALITNVSPAHLEGFGSIDSIASAKGEIYENLSASGSAIINLDDEYADFWINNLENKNILSFGIKNKADVIANNIEVNDQAYASFDLVYKEEKVKINLSLIGEHQVMNALSAAAVAIFLNYPLTLIKTGLEKVTSIEGRMTLKSGINGARIIDDTYNANPSSVEVAMKSLVKFSGTSILLLGDLAELGHQAVNHYGLIGEQARELGIDYVFSLGDLSQHASLAFQNSGEHFVDEDELLIRLKSLLDEHTTILVKGSRSSHMEVMVDKLSVLD